MTEQETGLDFDKIRAALDKEDWVFRSELGAHVRQIFIGTCFALTPSGKYYMPWTTNASEEEAERDQEWFDTVETALEKRGMFLTSGEGDPCDLLVAEITEDDPAGEEAVA